jgi:hypothetical protein
MGKDGKDKTILTTEQTASLLGQDVWYGGNS